MYKISKGFKEKYLSARQFRKQYGHLKVPLDYVVEIDGKKIALGMWIHNLRQAKTGNANWTTILPIEEKFLSKIDMEWGVYYNDFLKNYNKLIQNAVGRKIRNILEDEVLKQWMHNIIAQYQRGKLKGQRKELYEKNPNLFYIGYLKWQYNYSLAQQFYNKYGHLNIPIDYVSCGYNIGKWIQYQRRAYENGLLNQEEINQLEEIDMIWCLAEYDFINNKIDKYNRKRVYQKLKDRLLLFIDMYDEVLFEKNEQIIKLNNEFQKYLDYTKK